MRIYLLFSLGVLCLAQHPSQGLESIPTLDFRDLEVTGSIRLQKLTDFDDGYRAIPRPRLQPSASRYEIPAATGGGDLFYMMDVAFDSAGKGYGAGNQASNVVPARARRYDGGRYAIDSTFSVSLTIGAAQNTPFAVRPVPGENKVYLAGRTLHSVTTDWNGFVSRHLSNGALDTAFNTVGYTRFDLSGTSGADFFRGATVQSDGKLVVSGYTVFGGGSKALLARFVSNGGLDTSFATQGYALYTIAGAHTIFYRLSDDPAGGFIPVGVSGTGNGGQATLWRISSDGSLNTSFYTNGYRRLDQGSQSLGYSALWNTDSKIMVSGTYAYDPMRRAMFLYRLSSDGNLDTSFFTEGKIIQTFWAPSTGPIPWYAPSALTDTGKTVVAWGKTVNRFLSNGEADLSFSTSGFIIASADPQAMAFSTSGVVWTAYAMAKLHTVGGPIITQAVYEGAGYISPVPKSTIDFGYFPATTGTVTQTIQLTNNGSIATSLGVISGGVSAPYVFPGGSYPGTGGDCATTLDPSTSCNLVVSITTAANGRYDSQLRLGYQADGVSREINYPLTGAASDLSVTDFPGVHIGGGTGLTCGPTANWYTVTNNGGSSINLTGARVCDRTNATSNWDFNTNNCITSLASGATCTFEAYGNSAQPGCTPDVSDECRFEVYGDSDEGITLFLRGDLN